MTNDQIAQQVVLGSQAWMVFSIAAVLPILWAFTLVLHFARPFVIRYLQSLTLRFGGDVWWLGYVLMRDALLLVTLILSAVFLFPNLYIGLDLPITAPIAALVLFWALLVKITGDADDNARTYRIFSLLLVLASALYIVPQIYGVEAGDQVDAWNSIAGLGWIPGALVSSSNPNWAWPILNLSLIGFALTAGVIFFWFAGRAFREPQAAEAA